MNLDQLNALPEDQASQFFLQCCTSPKWVSKMVEGRPYKDFGALLVEGLKFWQKSTEQDKLDAFAGHPMIGDLDSLKAKFADTKTLAANEQSATATADDRTLLALHELNHRYLEQFGFIFIICATGRSAEFMLSELKSRIENSRETELDIAAQQQWDITEIRLQKALQSPKL